MLRLDVIGHDRRAPVLSPIEATSLTYPALTHVTGNTVTCLVHNYPQAQHLLLPICVGAKDSSQPQYNHCGAFSQSGHFILGVVDVADRVIVFYDSLVLSTTVHFITKNIPTLAKNIWGDGICTFRFTACSQQAQGSNDCAVYVFANVVLTLAQIPRYVFPFSPFGLPSVGALCSRVVFRILLHRLQPTKRVREESP